MSEIKNDGLDEYDKVLSLNAIGGERVKSSVVSSTVDLLFLFLVNYFRVLRYAKRMHRPSIFIYLDSVTVAGP